MKTTSLLIIIGLLYVFSCEKAPNIQHKKLQEKIIKENSNADDIKLFNKLLNDNYPIQKVNINSDGITDYIFYSMFGEKYFFDGKTKKQISAEIPLSKAGADETLKIIDINCGDNQNEFILQTAGGGTLGNYHGMEILRYNQKTKTISSIFSSDISIFNWEDGNEILEYVLYVDILYKKNKCNDTIKIYEGKFINKKESYNLNIKPVKLIKVYHFDKKTERFEKNVG